MILTVKTVIKVWIFASWATFVHMRSPSARKKKKGMQQMQSGRLPHLQSQALGTSLFHPGDNLQFTRCLIHIRVPTLSLSKWTVLEHFLLKLLNHTCIFKRLEHFSGRQYKDATFRSFALISLRAVESHWVFYVTGEGRFPPWKGQVTAKQEGRWRNRSARWGQSRSDCSTVSRQEWTSALPPHWWRERKGIQGLLRRKPGDDLNVGEDDFLAWIIE